MNRVPGQKGLFEVEEQMPCSPGAITLLRYVIPSTIDRAECEEAAARILSFSQQRDQWVGVSWRRLAEMMQKESETHRSIGEARSHSFGELRRVQRAVRRYYILCALTLGVYALFVAKPTAQIREGPSAKVPFSGIFISGADHVIIGILELLDKGFLRLGTKGEGENALEVFFPTPALVSRIMQQQGIAAS